MSITTPKKIISTNYKDNIPRINIRFIINKEGKEKFGFPYIAILDSGSNILSIPKDIADTLGIKTKEKITNVETSDGVREEKIQVADNINFEIWGDKYEITRFENEKARIGETYTSILIGTPVFQYYIVTFNVSKKLTILEPK